LYYNLYNHYILHSKIAGLGTEALVRHCHAKRVYRLTKHICKKQHP